jgi:uncharacterized protein
MAAITEPRTTPARRTVEQHSLPTSIILHLLPGVLLLGFVVAAAPVVTSWGMPVIFALFAGIGLVVVPFELGVLLVHARRTTGTFSLRSTVVYHNRLPLRRLLPRAAALWAWFLAVVLSSMFLLDQWIAETFFSWMPQAVLQFSATDSGDPLGGTALGVLVGTAVLFNGLVGPVVEELYFRGYLLPRIERFRRGAPVLGTVLFSLYHLWTPWQNPARIIGFLPMAWLAWRHRSVQLSMVAHVAVNLTFLALLAAVTLGGA